MCKGLIFVRLLHPRFSVLLRSSMGASPRRDEDCQARTGLAASTAAGSDRNEFSYLTHFVSVPVVVCSAHKSVISPG